MSNPNWGHIRHYEYKIEFPKTAKEKFVQRINVELSAGYGSLLNRLCREWIPRYWVSEIKFALSNQRARCQKKRWRVSAAGESTPYMAFFEAKNEDIGLENTRFWDIKD